MIVLESMVLLFAVPVSMWVIRTTNQDKLILGWIVPWSLLLFINSNPLDILIFILGLFLGYITDIVGVFAGKWYYPHYDNRLYSLSAGYGWGIITLIIFRLYFTIIDNLASFGWFILAIFLILWIIVEVTRGTTSFSNYWLVTRTVISLIFLFVSGDLLFVFVAAAVAIYIEVLGTHLKIWIYYDPSPSYLYLGTGYAQLSYLCLILANFFLFNVVPTFIQIILIIFLIFLYLIDYRRITQKQDTKGSKDNFLQKAPIRLPE
ncbi:MAG: hypothetical protein ACXAEU_10205 [Candidatus Hodarchaeales archaeon]|jgi:hypothetical protein